MNIVTVVGARPQFIKAAVVSHAFLRAGVAEQIVHTGQHYDPNMSDVFFSELGIPEPATNLAVGSGSHAVQTASIMMRLESYFLTHGSPDWLLVYGDTNSTIASALVGSKMGIPVAHVEAGLRSFNMRMPEEINRMVTDRLSSILFCPTQTAVDHLRREGLSRGVHLTGDVMLDATRHFAGKAVVERPLGKILGDVPETFFLATIHRAENTDDPARLAAILRAFQQMETRVILPLHPRTRAIMGSFTVPQNVSLIEPVSYLSMLSLISGAKRVLTDSGGLQKEAIWLNTPCVTLRDETEWVETLSGGWNQLTGANTDSIVNAVNSDPEGKAPSFGNAPRGTASDLITRLLQQ